MENTDNHRQRPKPSSDSKLKNPPTLKIKLKVKQEAATAAHLQPQEKDESTKDQQIPEQQKQQESARKNYKKKNQDDNQKQQQQQEREEEIKGSDQQALRVCHICKKGFKSGRALGGHMRVHSESMASKLNSQKPSPNANPNPHPNLNPNPRGKGFECDTCWKEFPSEKSLFGHLRSHPDRPWRGIMKAPSEPTPDPISEKKNPSSDLKDPSSEKEEEAGQGSGLADEEEELPKWGSRGKRGHNYMVEAAAVDLMRMQAGGRRDRGGGGEERESRPIVKKKVCRFDSDELYFLQNLDINFEEMYSDNERDDDQASPKIEMEEEEMKTLEKDLALTRIDETRNPDSIEKEMREKSEDRKRVRDFGFIKVGEEKGEEEEREWKFSPCYQSFPTYHAPDDHKSNDSPTIHIDTYTHARTHTDTRAESQLLEPIIQESSVGDTSRVGRIKTGLTVYKSSKRKKSHLSGQVGENQKGNGVDELDLNVVPLVMGVKDGVRC